MFSPVGKSDFHFNVPHLIGFKISDFFLILNETEYRAGNILYLECIKTLQNEILSTLE